MANYPPGPKGAFFGATVAQRFRSDPMKFITEMGRTYGDLAYSRMGPLRAYFVNHPDLVREVLVTKNKSFRRPPWMMRPLSKIDGKGLVLSDGDFWLRQRRLVQPAFSTKRFDRYAQVTVDGTQRMLERWTDETSFDMVDQMTRLTLDIIAKTLFGVELGEEAIALGEAVRTFSQSFVRDVANPFRLPDWVPTARNRRKRQAIQTVDDLVCGIIRDRRASGEDHGDLLSMLLLAVDEEGDGRGMTDAQARDEAVTLFNAGHDSTAASLAWIWYLVAKHADVQDKLVEEIDRVLAGRPGTYAEVPQLPYAEMVVKESLRLYPPTWILIPREVVDPIDLAGYTVPRGSWIYTSPWVTHRDPRFFDDPERFDPQRFGPGRVEQIPQYAYFPFGGGPRVCIGNTFATMEMILIVASVLQKFRVRLAADQGDVEPEPLIAIRPKGGLRVSLERRTEPAYAGRS
jgi:cytochrome P450